MKSTTLYEVNKAIEAQKKEAFPDGICRQMLKISVRHAHLSIMANDQKDTKKDSTKEIRQAAVDLIATLFIFLNHQNQTK